MKKLLKILAGLVVLLLLIGTGAWFYTGHQVKTATIKSIDAMNAKFSAPSPDMPFQLHLSYDALEQTGLPPSLTMRLVNPHFEVKGTLPQRADMPASAADAPPAAPLDFAMSWKLQGTATVTRDYLKHAYRIAVAGSDLQNIQLGNQSIALENKQVNTQVELAARTAKDFWAWEHDGGATPQSFNPESIGHLAIDAGPFMYRLAGTETPALESGGAHLMVTNRSDAQYFDIAFDSVTKDAQIHEAFGQFMDQIMVTLAHQPPATPITASGKTNMEIAFTLRAPRNGTQDGTFTLSMPRASFSNAFGSVSMPTDVLLERQGTNAKGHVKSLVTTTVTPEGGKNTETEFTKEVMKIMGGKFRGDAPLDMAALQASLIAALPNASTVGPIVATVDGTFDIDMAKHAGKLDVANIGLDHSRWGLTLSGNGDATANPPVVNFNLHCKKCEFLTYDLITQAMQVQQVMQVANASFQPRPIGKELHDQLNALLAQFGKKDAEGSLDFAITMPTPGDIQINGQPFGMFMGQMMQILAPIMAPPPPAAAPEGKPAAKPQKSKAK